MRLLVGFPLALSVLAGCGGSSGQPTGSEKGPCYPNGTCNAGLTCLSDTCVNVSPAGGAGGSAKFDGAVVAAGDAADALLRPELDGDRDDGAQDISITGAGGVMSIDASTIDDAGQSGGGAGTGGGGGSSGGSTGSGGVSGTGGTSTSGGLDGGGAGSDGASGGDGPGGGGVDGGAADGSGGANCSPIAIAASHVPADVLLVLDRSGSMDSSIAEDCFCTPTAGGQVCSNTSGCTDRWSALAAAVDATLTSSTAVHWGLKLYPSTGGSSCTVSSTMEVPVSAASVSAIQAQIANATIGLNTPTTAAITAATAYLRTVADANNKAILLATDGEPNCKGGSSSGTPDVDGAITAIAAAENAGFLVYVVGIGPSVGNLDNFAQAGGTGHYYPAISTAELTDAFVAISQAATTCTYTLATAPPDPNNMAVYLDQSIVPQSTSNGWTFGASSQTILLGGSFCDRIVSGSAASVQALFGCPGGSSFPQVLP